MISRNFAACSWRADTADSAWGCCCTDARVWGCHLQAGCPGRSQGAHLFSSKLSAGVAGSRSTSLAVLAAASTGSWLSLQPGSGPAGGQCPGASGPATVPRQGRACPATGTHSSVLRQRQWHAVPGAPSPCLTWTSVGASLVMCPSQSHPPAVAPLLTMGPGEGWNVLPVLCSGLCRVPRDVHQLTTAFVV